ncbi:MAG: hypothetical protein AAF848_00150 [Pseudomonadota bacterium]
MRTFLRLLVVVILSGAVLAGAMFFARVDLIYVFDTAQAAPADMPRTQVLRIPEFNGDPALTVWVTQPEPGEPVVIYFMGEGGSLSVDETRLRRFANAGFGIAAMAYRGGGGQPGRPSEEALYRDALRVYAGLDRLFGRRIRDTDRVIYGFSLGTGIAARLAVEQEELALILEAPYTNYCAVKTGVLRYAPGCLVFEGHMFDTENRIDQVGAPVLILHGNIDERYPVEQAEQVFNVASEPKFLEIYNGGSHENLARFGAGDDAISFVRVLRGAR